MDRVQISPMIKTLIKFHTIAATLNIELNVATANTTLDFKVAMFILLYIAISFVDNYGCCNYA
jgi:hypothetical protein